MEERRIALTIILNTKTQDSRNKIQETEIKFEVVFCEFALEYIVGN